MIMMNRVLTHPKVGIALAEANAPHIPFIIDLDNKPAWYQLKVNPAGKVRHLTFFIWEDLIDTLERFQQ